MGKVELEQSGIPLLWDEETLTVSLGEGLVAEGSGRKAARQMVGLLANESGVDPEERAYDTIARVCRPEDRERFLRYGLQYDLTIVMPGTFNGECKKTSGHYHGWNKARTHTFGEVYEVLMGSALFILQRSPDFEEMPESNRIDDVVLVRVDAGQTLLVPPDYGHASVNVGDGALIFSDLAYRDCPIHYESPRAHRGMSYYVMRNAQGGLRAMRNPSYGPELPSARFATVHDNPELGIDFSAPLYRGFLRHPESYAYLAEPDGYIEQIMALLDFGTAPFEVEA